MKTPAMSIAFGQMNVIPSIKFENGFIASRSVQADNVLQSIRRLR